MRVLSLALAAAVALTAIAAPSVASARPHHHCWWETHHHHREKVCR